jgi:hypothetical protein
MAAYEENDVSWKKPAWATNGPGLRKTGRAPDKKLESDITSLPHQKEDGPFSKPEWTEDVGDMDKPEGNLAKDITSAPHTSSDLQWQKPDWTKEAGLKGTGKGDKLRSGNDIARPIGG